MPLTEKRYAEELSKLLGIPEKKAKKIVDLMARRWRKKIVEAFKPEEIEIPKVEAKPKTIKFAIPFEDLVELISPRLKKFLTSKEFIDTIVGELLEKLDYEIRRILFSKEYIDKLSDIIFQRLSRKLEDML